jgi:hypothetical protein
MNIGVRWLISEEGLIGVASQASHEMDCGYGTIDTTNMYRIKLT